MSIYPIYNASFVGLLLLGFFMWKISLLLFCLLFIVFSIILYFFDNNSNFTNCVSGFWLFVFSEVAIFGSLLFCCLYFDTIGFENLSSSLEIPFVGCFVLLGSSLTITSFHHLLSWKYSNLFLLLTIFLGICFIILQALEMEEIIMNIYDSSFYASSFCTVGLHFSHVLLGVVGLLTLLSFGLEALGYYHCSILVWYWHFVDYVWLFVYTIVYVC